MFRLSSVLPLALLALSASWFGGCDSATGSSGPAGTGPELAAGSYFIQYDSDDRYRFEQYFVVLPGYHWEFVEYGYVPSTKNLCQVTRSKGNYSSTDSSVTLTGVAGGAPIEKCGITKSEFDAYPFETDPSSPMTHRIRNVTATGFEGEDFTDGTAPGWRTYSKKTDPYGFF